MSTDYHPDFGRGVWNGGIEKMRNNYDRGFDNGYEIIDAEFKKLSPYWVYAVADRTWLGLDPIHTFINFGHRNRIR